MAPDLVIPDVELTVQVSRSGGPGGQNVNKVASRVTLRWSVVSSRALDEECRARLLKRLHRRLSTAGELILHVAEHRSQLLNRAAARDRLASIVAAALRTAKVRGRTSPTKASQRRRSEGKRRKSEVKRLRGRPAADD
ncbi:MAG: alternative ribosome rescue aminoacyl-tRNA hydrolase ArfB [Planctomycetota bacterium]